MNKILRLSLIALLAVFCGGGAFAQEVTLDFTTNDWGLPVGSSNKGTTAQDFSNGTYTITLQAADGFYYNTNKYLMLGKKNSTLTLPAFTFDVEKIEVVGNKNASAAVVQNIYVGDEAVSTATTGAGNTSAAITNTYIIADGKQAAGTIYTLKITSAHNTQITTINIYKKTATSKSAAGLTFSESNISIKKGETFTAPTFTKSTTADVTFSSNNEGVATVNAEGVISLGTEIGTAVITATSEENDDYYAGTATCTIEVYEVNTYKKATAVVNGGKYLLVAQRDGKTQYAMPIASNKTYGYLNVSTIEGLVDEIDVKKKYNDEFVVTAVEGGYTIQDCYDRYLAQAGTHASFQIVETPAAWTIEPQADGTFKISMNGYYIQWGQGTFTTFGLYTEAQANAVMPMLYASEDTPTGITNVVSSDAANENAPIYNLAGQRVNKTAKGILIQNGKKFVNK